MTVGTLFSNISMFVDKRSLILHVAAGAKGFCGYALEVVAVGREVWIVAIGAGHLVLRNRMMGELGEFHPGLCVTAGAELFLRMTADFLLWPFMQFVAVKTAYIVQGMHT